MHPMDINPPPPIIVTATVVPSLNEPAAAAAPELWPIAGALRGPTLVVRGGISDILSVETASEMTHRMKDCRAVEVPGVGHAPLLSEPEALRALRDFFGVG